MHRLGEGREGGFTIIEVIFFLAISSALLVALFSTVGFTISRQRFTDSTVGTQGYVQSQYNETLNVVNERTTGSCTIGSDNATVLGGGSVHRGESSSPTCVVLGKTLEFNYDTSRVVSYSVIGHEPTDPGTASGSALLAKYAPAIDADSAQTYDIPWDAKVIKLKRAGTDENLSRITILRAPDSGLVLTYAGTGPNLIDAVNAGTGTFNLCLRSADITNAVAAVTLSPIAGAEGVTTKSDLDGTELAATC